MNPSAPETLFARFLTGWARRVIQRPRWFVIPQLGLFVACIFYTATHLQFDTNRSTLVGANKRYHHNFLQYKKDFAVRDDLAVIVESDNPEKNRQFVERLGAKVEAATIALPISPGALETRATNLYTRIFYKGDLKLLGNKALLFVAEDKLVGLQETIEEYRPLIQPFTQTSNLVSLINLINRRFANAKPEASAENDALVKALPALERIIAQATASLQRGGVPPSPGVFALFDASPEAEQSIYLTYADGQIYLLTAQPLTEDLNHEAIQRLRELIAETKLEVPGVNVGLTGESVLELDELRQSQQDTTVASIISLIVCALIFIYGYHQTGRPLKATACLIVGIGYTLGFTTLVIGHLNILTITFVPILIGLAIDFGVHLVTRYEEELRHGKSPEAAITLALVFTGQGIFTGAFTTAGAFLAMAFTDFRGIQEMGIICGGGLLVCLIPMTTLLPVWLLRGRQNVIDHAHANQPERRAHLERFWLQRPLGTIVVISCLSVAGLTQVPKVAFDYNLLHMQSAGLPAVEFQEKLLHATSKSTSSTTNTNESGRSVLFAVMVTDSLTNAVALQHRVEQLGSVARVESIAPLLADEATRKLQLIGEIKAAVQSLNFQLPDPNPAQPADLSRSLFALGGFAKLAVQQINDPHSETSQQLTSLGRAIEKLRVEMLRGSSEDQTQAALKLGNYQRALFDDLRDTFDALKQQDNRGRLRIADLPETIRDRFVSVNGRKFLSQVYPQKDVWQHDNQKQFVEDLRTLDPDVTGTPVQLLEYITLLKESYEHAALYSLGAIALLILIHFRSIGSVILALLPVGIGSLWLAGVMGGFHLSLNPANIMLLPLVLGIGVTNGIHILNRFAEEHTPSILGKSTGKAVLVSGLTTIAGFGSLMVAQHRGIASLGLVMAIGVAACMIVALTFLPAVLTLLLRRTTDKNQPSGDNAQSPLGREEPR